MATVETREHELQFLGDRRDIALALEELRPLLGRLNP
jgi:hypothetical protein